MTPTPNTTLPTALNGRIVGSATIIAVNGKRVKTASNLIWEWDDEIGALVKPGDVGKYKAKRS